MGSILNSADVASLLKDPSVANRAATVEKVGRTFGDASLSDKERALAEGVLRAMLRDAEVRVRKALAESVKENPDLPHDMAATLANDVADVASPIRQYSKSLSDEDLPEII